MMYMASIPRIEEDEKKDSREIKSIDEVRGLI